MWPSDDFCGLLGVPDYLHTSKQAPNQNFEAEERLYRRHKLNDRKIKTIINFRQMSVNRSSCCRSPADALINTHQGGEYSGFGVVSFSVGAVHGLRHEELQEPANTECAATVFHEPERCNYSHTIVHGRMNKVNLSKSEDLPKIFRKLFRKQLWESIITEIPVERKDEPLEAGSWL